MLALPEAIGQPLRRVKDPSPAVYARVAYEVSLNTLLSARREVADALPRR